MNCTPSIGSEENPNIYIMSELPTFAQIDFIDESFLAIWTKLQFDASISAYDHRYSEGFGASGKVKISLYSNTVHPDLVVKHNFVLDFQRCISTSLYTKCLNNYNVVVNTLFCTQFLDVYFCIIFWLFLKFINLTRLQFEGLQELTKINRIWSNVHFCLSNGSSDFRRSSNLNDSNSSPHKTD